jgi:hypothetical protein
MSPLPLGGLGPKCPLSLWERVRVRAVGRGKRLLSRFPRPLTPGPSPIWGRGEPFPEMVFFAASRRRADLRTRLIGAKNANCQ